MDDPAWRLDVDGVDPAHEPAVEAWFTVGNGRTGTRGVLEEDPPPDRPALYVAGVYGSPTGPDAYPELVPGPLWTVLDLRVGEAPVRLGIGEAIEHRRSLDMRTGTLWRFWRHRLPTGEELTFRSARFASLADPVVHVLVAEAHGVAGVRLDGRLGLPDVEGPVAHVVVARDGVVSAYGRSGGSVSAAVDSDERDGSADRIVVIDRQVRGHRPPDDPREAIERARRRGVARLHADHAAAWARRWDDADVVVDGDAESQRALRFAMYHLIASSDPTSDLVSVAARGLTGPGYRGHIFWDTEAYAYPPLLYTHPPTARALMGYRHRTLPAAHARAHANGYKGALYAWESADTGEDATPDAWIDAEGGRHPVLTGRQEHHISAVVAWAVWRYWQATADDEFMLRQGAEIVLETARFWASRARRGRDGRYHIDKIIGPDEYHEGVRDNAFTNVMARWTLRRGIEAAAVVPELDAAAWDAIRKRLRVTPAELRRWGQVADLLVDGFDPETKLFEQHAGFFALDDVRAEDIAPRPFSGDAIVPRGKLRRSQLIKQADVVVLCHMLADEIPDDVVEANYRYYEPRTAHGSSLSPAIHATVAARIGDMEQALAYFRMGAKVDLGGTMFESSTGIHIATQGGLWQAAVMGFGGVRAEGDTLRIDPRLPGEWGRLRFVVRWRGARIAVTTDGRTSEADTDARVRLALGTGAAEVRDPGVHRWPS